MTMFQGLEENGEGTGLVAAAPPAPFPSPGLQLRQDGNVAPIAAYPAALGAQWSVSQDVAPGGVFDVQIQSVSGADKVVVYAASGIPDPASPSGWSVDGRTWTAWPSTAGLQQFPATIHVQEQYYEAPGGGVAQHPAGLFVALELWQHNTVQQTGNPLEPGYDPSLLKLVPVKGRSAPGFNNSGGGNPLQLAGIAAVAGAVILAIAATAGKEVGI